MRGIEWLLSVAVPITPISIYKKPFTLLLPCIRDRFRAEELGGREFTPQDAAAAWGYASTAGPVKNRIAALRQYGMLEGKKGDNPKLSNRALTLILRDPGALEHREALRVAVSDPDIFEELDRTMPNAADDALRQHLIVQRNFTREGADRLIVVFRASMAYADAYKYDNITAQDQPEDNEERIEMLQTCAVTSRSYTASRSRNTFCDYSPTRYKLGYTSSTVPIVHRDLGSDDDHAKCVETWPYIGESELSGADDE